MSVLLAEYRAVAKLAAQEKVRSEMEADRLATPRRRSDTRRKIIIGGAILAAFREDPASLDDLLALLGRRITAPRDRALVGQVLPIEDQPLPLEEPPIPAPPSTSRRPHARMSRSRRSEVAIDPADVPSLVPELPAPLEATLLALLHEAEAAHP